MAVPGETPSSVAEADWSKRMAAAQAGDRAAYEALLRDLIPHVRRMVRHAGVRPDLADDATQDVLLAVHRARHTFDPDLSFMAWLSAIARHRAIDLLRRRGRQDGREVSSPEAYEAFPDTVTTPDQAFEGRERGKQLRAAVARLTPGQREAVEVLGLREQSLAEAAVQTGKTVGSLKVNLHRALKALRRNLGETER